MKNLKGSSVTPQNDRTSLEEAHIRRLNKKTDLHNRKSDFQQILRVGINACFLFVFAHSFEPNYAVYESEQRIVFTDTYVRAGMNLRASLANENVPCENRLTVASFHAKSFSLAVSTVVGRTGTFLMSE